MNCERCADIHKAQLEGKTQESCKCICHAPKPNYGTTCIPFTWTNATTCDAPFGTNTLWTHDYTQSCNCVTSGQQCEYCKSRYDKSTNPNSEDRMY